MDIDERQQGAITVVIPQGPLNHVNSESFGKRMKEMVTQNLGRFVVDMSHVPFADSRGLETLVDVSDLLHHSGQSLKLCEINETIREIFTLTDLSKNFEFYQDTGDAARSFLA